MDALKRKLKPIKANITRIHNWVISNETVSDDIYEFEIKKEQLGSFYEKYTDLLEEIEDFESVELSNDCELLETKYCSTLVRLRHKMDRLTCVADKEQPLQHNLNIPSVKLPDISVATFSGNFIEWRTFFELFDTLIIQNLSLTNIQRFVYLKSYLKGEPLQLIDSLPLSNDNFEVAIQTLKDRYDNEFRITNTLIKNLLNVSDLIKSPSGIRKFVIQAKQSIQSLSNLNVPKDEWADLILIHIYLQKLDFQTNRSFESERDSNKRPTLQEFFEFLEKRCCVLETVSENFPKSNGHSKQHSKVSHFSELSKTSSLNSSKGKHQYQNNCLCCKQTGHPLYNCINFKKLSAQQRFKFTKDNRLCRNCLSKGHSIESCQSEKNCFVCGKRHHTLLHNPDLHHVSQSSASSSGVSQHHSFECREPLQISNSGSTAVNTQEQPHSVESSATTCSAVSDKATETLLATAMVALYNDKGEKIIAHALLDNGSQTSFVTKALVNKLNCKTHERHMQITSISQQITNTHQMTNLEIHSTLPSARRFRVKCVILDKITSNLPKVTIQSHLLEIPKNVILANPNFLKSQPIDLLLGMDIYGEILCEGFKRLGRNLPVLINTHLGWTVSGNLETQLSPHQYESADTFFLRNNEDFTDSEHTTNELLERFWAVEEVNIKPEESEDEVLAEQLFSATTRRTAEGRFEVQLPLKSPHEHHKLGESFLLARKRFLGLEQKFKKHQDLFLDYQKFINEYLALGHAKEIPLVLTNAKSELKYFLPHHCVVRQDSLTTKLRVVFDASMKTETGYSLNDLMLKGSTMQPDLFDILCRFRTYQFVFITDIEKMYRQVLIQESNRFLQNILWRENPADEMRCLELQTVTYGTNSAPFLSTRCLVELARSNREMYPLGADALLKQCYVDDILFGAETISELQDAYQQITKLLSTACMTLHKWTSNSTTFLRSISLNHSHPNYIISSENKSNKVLGIQWSPLSDTFTITLPDGSLDNNISKREVLSNIAKIFDPVGLINPYVVIAKILMQKIWLSKIGWDDHLNDELMKEWKSFASGISELHTLSISRNLFTQPRSEVKTIEIHSFSDASEKCYGTCVYLRVIYELGSSCNLICSKSRVAPLKRLTIPRLELSGALLMAQLTDRIVKVFADSFLVDVVHLWTDSQIVLSWLNSHPSRWTTFVANRVSEIQTLTSSFQWHHVSSANNPADILSRGCMPKDLLKSDLWWHGPKFMTDLNSDFSKHNFRKPIVNLPDERKTLHHLTSTHNDDFQEILCRFSSFRKLQRVLAFCKRFIYNCTNAENKQTGPLSVKELQDSENAIVKYIQKLHFSTELKELKTTGQIVTNKSMRNLCPILDEMSLIRVGGRLLHANVNYEQRHPILLPSKHFVVRLIIEREHQRQLHAGPQAVLSNLRLCYWPIDGLRETKGVIRKCVRCFRCKPQTAEQQMGNIPKERFSMTIPFHNTGVDFAGPFLVKPSK